MQPRNRIFDDLGQLMTNAMGVAQGAREEAETAMKSMMDRWLADRDFVTREEFDAVRAMAQKAREENDALRARLDAMEGGAKPAESKTAGPKAAGPASAKGRGKATD
ncbi:MAG: accessory factor UbiK family protein [Paracoccaceae bacterium]